MVAGLLLPSTRVRLVVCSETGEDAAEVVTLLPRVATISIPPVAERAHELDRLLAAYGSDAMAELRARSLGFRRADLELVRAWVGTLDEIETFARRLVALRNWGIVGGARRLGINHGALSRWARRRQLAR
jgi:DNA-binding NtrC family response regulator